MNDLFPCSKELGVKKFLKDKGLKATPQRLAVLHVLHTNPKYLEINEILEKTKELLPKTGLATIYRTLEMLVDLDLIVRVHFQDGCHSYAISPEGHGHHMVCTACNKVMDFEDCPFENYLDELANETGFKIQNHFVQLFGQCSECR